jgi:Protein of unknown function (DUF4089)
MKYKPVRKSKPRRVKRAGKSRAKAHAQTKSSRPDSIETLVETSAQALGISLDSAWRDGIALNLRLILRHANLVDEFELPDHIEPASVYHA